MLRSNRVLNFGPGGNALYSGNNLTLANCATQAAAYGATLFGLEGGFECWVGIDEARAYSQGALAQSSCNWACTGDPSSTCGGAWAVQIYKFNNVQGAWRHVR